MLTISDHNEYENIKSMLNVGQNYIIRHCKLILRLKHEILSLFSLQHLLKREEKCYGQIVYFYLRSLSKKNCTLSNKSSKLVIANRNLLIKK